jgi:hypothetical protein
MVPEQHQRSFCSPQEGPEAQAQESRERARYGEPWRAKLTQKRPRYSERSGKKPRLAKSFATRTRSAFEFILYRRGVRLYKPRPWGNPHVLSPSSRGPGLQLFTLLTGVRIPLGTPKGSSRKRRFFLLGGEIGANARNLASSLGISRVFSHAVFAIVRDEPSWWLSRLMGLSGGYSMDASAPWLSNRRAPSMDA